ncbi:MAG: deoxyribodipyrimidine photo-lyase [Bacteroidales bacterium]|nr:deoxyribodipyrimidine photo-lyase [Bacteroidales bacterium]
MLSQRARQTNVQRPGKGPVLYWMSRDQRLEANWALIFAQQLASRQNTEFAVVFNLSPNFLGATIRQYDFMLKGLMELERKLKERSIPFYLLIGKPAENIPLFCKEHQAGTLVADFNPLGINKQWVYLVSSEIDIAFYQVDAHNIVPCWQASNKQEFGAYTLRPKIKKLLPLYLDEFPAVSGNKSLKHFSLSDTNWNQVYQSLAVDQSVMPVSWLAPGEYAAQKALNNFLNHRLDQYATERNNPVKQALSNLSPYLHFGNISSQNIAKQVIAKFNERDGAQAFLEELIIRKELSDNFCFYNPAYASFDGFPNWAKNTLDLHRADKRDFLYGTSKLEQAGSHDPLWNAAQLEMTKTGKMHGYMRMYWAKKLLEWTASPEEALKTAIYLNDKYLLDGRDPNGYAGCAWAIGGLHDRPWKERAVFGKIRYMNDNGAKRKFDVQAYINLVNSLPHPCNNHV